MLIALNGDLRWYEYLPVGLGVSILGSAFMIMLYNLVKNKKSEESGVMTKGIPYKERIVYSAIGSVVVSLLVIILG